ncbi:hypothetical protein NZ698_09105 [Chryseobacterium sp. PBS4-4]|uniref:TonB C-terminal domain-containing protein n=1 Tax=Chryseobacterium edaphi TaxID=2976532 RepID=A0ABT2W578_9FLAO|nr:hypothetical protein [Chryseobacterium edaphi]MCU7617356.1 hypothetical protein [Chryseobacterium edaphi]
MKTLALFLSLFVGNFVFAQYDIEDQEETMLLENNKTILKIKIEEPFLQVALKNCDDFKAASYPDGINNYKETLRRYMYNYLNSDFYVLNGDFVFTLSVDQSGKVTNIEGSPKVNNSQVFFDDMKYVVRRIKKNWIPANCNGNPIASEVKIKMNFSSIATDL